MGVGPTCSARKGRGRLGLAHAACPWGAVSAGLTAPALRSRAGAQGLLGEPLVRRGSAQCGVGQWSAFGGCVSGGAPGLGRAVRCPHWPVLQKERPTPLPRLTPGPGQGEWLAEDWTCSLRQGRLARAWSPILILSLLLSHFCKLWPKTAGSLNFSSNLNPVRESPSSPVDRKSLVLSLPMAWVTSLVRELRSCKSYSIGQKKKRKVKHLSPPSLCET